MGSYKTPAELQEMAQEGKQFAKRVSNELLDYADRAATRHRAAARFTYYFGQTADPRFDGADPKLLEDVSQEAELASAEFRASTAAAEFLRRVSYPEAIEADLCTVAIRGLGRTLGLPANPLQ